MRKEYEFEKTINLQTILDKIKDIFELKHWNIVIVENRDMEEEAQTLLIYNDYKATIRINISRSKEEQELSLVHELVHIILRDTQDIYKETTKGKEIPIYNRLLERETENLAKGIYKLLKEE